jgi:hypothetical protein
LGTLTALDLKKMFRNKRDFTARLGIGDGGPLLEG